MKIMAKTLSITALLIVITSALFSSVDLTKSPIQYAEAKIGSPVNLDAGSCNMLSGNWDKQNSICRLLPSISPYSTSVLKNGLNIPSGSGIEIRTGATLIIPSNSQLTGTGFLSNYGMIDNRNTFTFSGVLDNIRNGTQSSGVITNEASGIFTSYSTNFSNLQGATVHNIGIMKNYGIITNGVSGPYVLGPSIIDDGTFANFGTITNNFNGKIMILNSVGTGINNYGTITNSGKITVSNSGGVGINNSGTINNYGTIYQCIGTIIGIITGIQPVTSGCP